MKLIIRFVLLTLCILNISFSHACLIVFMADEEQVLVGNHEDWFSQDAAIKVNTPTNNRLGSVVFTFMSEGWAQGGMNEKGLFFDGTLTPFQELIGENKEVFQGYIWQQVLDRCASVEEALTLLSNYKLTDLEQAHILLADASGEVALIGVERGKVVVKRQNNKILVQTNFNPWQPELSEEKTCWRYEKAVSYLKNFPKANSKHVLEVLKQTHQDKLTVYSNIYDLKNRKITLFNKRNFTQPIQFSIVELLKLGSFTLPLDSLSRQPKNLQRLVQSYSDEQIVYGKIIDLETKEGVPYANIGIPNKELGTIADQDGTFMLRVPEKYLHDTLQVSSISYQPIKMTVQEVATTASFIKLPPSPHRLKEVTIEAKSFRKQTRLGWMRGKEGVLPLDSAQGGSCVALLLEAPEKPFQVAEVQFRLMYNSKDTLRLRLHFYEFDSINQLPGKEILHENIILKGQKKFGWLKFDLRKYLIQINQKRFLVGFEWIEDKANRIALLNSLRDWSRWKEKQFLAGNPRVELREITKANGQKVYVYKYNGNMMNWPGWNSMPPFFGLMVDDQVRTGNKQFKTFERKTSFGKWYPIQSTLNAVVVIAY